MVAKTKTAQGVTFSLGADGKWRTDEGFTVERVDHAHGAGARRAKAWKVTSPDGARAAVKFSFDDAAANVAARRRDGSNAPWFGGGWRLVGLAVVLLAVAIARPPRTD